MWAKLAGRMVSGTVWEQLAEEWQSLLKPGPDRIDLEELERLFSLEERAKKSAAKAPAKKKQTTVSLLDPKVGNNCAIALSKFRMPNEDLCAAVWAMDHRVLDEEAVESLLPFVPTSEEKEALAAYSGAEDALGRAERYYRLIMHIPRLAQRLRSWDIAYKFEPRVEYVRSQQEAAILACRAVKTSKHFKRLLELILAVGNVLNAGTFRGNAVAVQIGVLAMLKDVKAPSKPGMTLLRYLVLLIKEERKDHLFKVLDDFEYLEEASKIDFSHLKAEAAKIQSDLATIAKEVETVRGLAPSDAAKAAFGGRRDGFVPMMEDFCESCEHEALEVGATQEMLEAKLSESIVLVGEDPAKMEPATFLRLLETFRADLSKVLHEDEKAKSAAALRKNTGETAKQTAKIARQKRAAQQMMGEESSVLALDQQVSEKLVSGAEDWYSAPD